MYEVMTLAYPQFASQPRLVLPNLAKHLLRCLPLEEVPKLVPI